jgi:toxin HigB-1
MDLSFADSKLKQLCENPRDATRELGPASAKRLQSRLADLVASANPTELPAGRPHPLKDNRFGRYSVRLHGGHRLVFEADDNPVPMTKDDAIDWLKITSIRIVYIGDYHD